MIPSSTDRMLRFAPLATIALLFGVLGPFASFIGNLAGYQYGPSAWPTGCAFVVGCAMALLLALKPRSQTGPRALLVYVCAASALLSLGRWAPGFVVVGALGVTTLIPMLTVAIGLSRSSAHSSGEVAALVAFGPAAWLLTKLVCPPISSLLRGLAPADAALAIGTISLAGTATIVWRLPWPAPSETSRLPEAGRPWARIASCMIIAAVANVEMRGLADAVGTITLYLVQTVGLPICGALMLLRVSARHRAAAYLAATLTGRMLGAAASLGLDYTTR